MLIHLIFEMIIKQEYQTDRKKYTSVQYKREKKRIWLFFNQY